MTDILQELADRLVSMHPLVRPARKIHYFNMTDAQASRVTMIVATLSSICVNRLPGWRRELLIQTIELHRLLMSFVDEQGS